MIKSHKLNTVSDRVDSFQGVLQSFSLMGLGSSRAQKRAAQSAALQDRQQSEGATAKRSKTSEEVEEMLEEESGNLPVISAKISAVIKA